MADEGDFKQDSASKKDQYFGSARDFYIGSTVGSTSAWTFFNFSGTNTGFGTANNILSNRFAIRSSGTSFIQWSINSGTTLSGELYGTNATFTKDGVNVSGVWVRTNTASQGFQIWAW